MNEGTVLPGGSRTCPGMPGGGGIGLVPMPPSFGPCRRCGERLLPAGNFDRPTIGVYVGRLPSKGSDIYIAELVLAGDSNYYSTVISRS